MNANTGEPIVVEAEILDTELSSSNVAIDVRYTPAEIHDNIDAIDAYVNEQLELYRDWVIDPRDYDQIKLARKAMADLNKLKEPIEKERKRIKREYEAPLKVFEGRVKGITSNIDNTRNFIKEQVDKADEEYKAIRREELQEEYEGCVGILADVISFDAVLDPQWLNRSYGDIKASNELFEKVQNALAAYETLKTKNLNHKDEVVKRFADTLDLVAALKLEDELNEKDRQMAEFKKAQAEAEAFKAQRTVEPTPERHERSEPPIKVWHLEMEFTGTREKALAVRDALVNLGITGANIECRGGSQ